MTFAQARAISKINKLHIRRASWAEDKWFMIWRGTWFCFTSGLVHPVHATDYIPDDLRATDWTTVPAPLASCPSTPSEPVGGNPPVPGTPGWPDIPDLPPFFPGSPGGSGSPSITLPPPDDGTSIRVRFNGITDTQTPTEEDPAVYFDGDKLNNTWSLEAAGPGHWKKSAFPVGYYRHPDVDEKLKIFWNIEVTKTADGLFSVALYLDIEDSENIFLSGGFRTDSGTEKARHQAITNGATAPLSDGVMCFGFATVL